MNLLSSILISLFFLLSSCVSKETTLTAEVSEASAVSIYEVSRIDGQVEIRFSLPDNGIAPVGGHQLYINGNENSQPLSADKRKQKVFGLMLSQKQCFRYQSLYTQFDEPKLLLSNEVCLEAEAPKLPLGVKIESAQRIGEDYKITFELLEHSLEAIGGYNLHINGTNSNYTVASGLREQTISGLDNSVQQCFKYQSIYSNMTPLVYPISNQVCVDAESSEELKAFPTAYGGGAYATGGRGGNVYHVTHLRDDGSEGSFRWALNQWNKGADGPATIVFDVSGVINMNDYIVIAGKDLTIAGQTAPSGGITFTSTNPNNKFRMWGVENIIIRYLRFRFQKDNNNIGIDVFGNNGGGYDPVARNLMFDHLSISYAGWTGFGCRGRDNYNVTVQNSLFAESKTGAIFGDSDSPYSYDNSFLNNFFYNVSHRFPNPSASGRVDVINNVTQNHTWRLSRPQISTQLNHINNYHAAGSNNSMGLNNLNQITSGRGGSIYTSGNIIDKGIFTDPTADNKSLWAEFNGGSATSYAPASEFTDTQFPLIGAPFPIKSASEAYNSIINAPTVGNSRYLKADGSIDVNYDDNDAAYLAKTAEGEGAYEAYTTGQYGEDRSFFHEQRYFNFLDSITDVPVNTRPANYDSDRDGMADQWESATFGDLSRDGKGDFDGDGYTDLEEFLNLVDI